MKKIFAILLLGAAITATGLAQAPASIGGLTWRGEWNFSARSSFTTEMYSIDFRPDGTFVTRLGLIWNYSSPGPASESYQPVVVGTYTYQQLSNTSAMVTLSSSDAPPASMPLQFTNSSQGLGYAGAPFSLNPTGGNGTSRALVNMSTLISAKQGSPVVFGFVVGGNTPWREVLIRAVGPSLSQFGITNFALNPTYTISNIAPYQTNIPNMLLPGASGQNWSAGSAGPTLTAENARAGAFGLLPGSNDKADVVLLVPGSYTIMINPTDASSEGAELVEVYEVE